MARKPDTPCTRCGKLLWSGRRSLPAEDRLCQDCRAAPAPPAPVSMPAASFGPRGARLWRDTTTDPVLSLSPAELVLLEETCRLADRLDRLDAFLTGREDAWLRFWRTDDGTTVKVVVDRALTEVRQQQDTFRGMVADLMKKAGVAPAPEKPEATRRDELAKRRQERRGAASQ